MNDDRLDRITETVESLVTGTPGTTTSAEFATADLDEAVATGKAGNISLGSTGAAPATTGDEARRKQVELDADTVERDLAKLVLTVVELLRQLMERQALRRVDTGELTEDQEERIGMTLMLLEDRMDILRDKFGLKPEDLNIDLGPLGPLLPRN
ncbi:hypothetical protein GCM10010329_40350 [Streptomyces spiroverticillatus]|uniref:Gas vesicle protein K n=1 Tax=Streptomyces finlayi TaxID=67296 RepID=A0A918WZA4_9ACTN|nr:hypothetical protein GCM10010329_40350 [Streptomyces spiroverticillatus]GHC97938.1 hypothetical protein GCM10010334_39890 [Streptomyces finlayi]